MIEIFWAMSFMAETVLATAEPPSEASVAACSASFSVWRAFSAFWRMLALISSIDEETSSTLAACSVAPWDRPSDEAASSCEPEATLSAAERTSDTTSLSLVTIAFREEARVPVSSFPPVSRVLVKSPSDMVWAKSTPSFSLAAISFRAVASWPTSSLRSMSMTWFRLPSATARAKLTLLTRGALMMREMNRPRITPSSTQPTTMPISSARSLW